ncbi:MAG: mycofactocin biosynthesis glycosyltransferase MftF [Oscillochloridaceae bacterium umkhey_bin13]
MPSYQPQTAPVSQVALPPDVARLAEELATYLEQPVSQVVVVANPDASDFSPDLITLAEPLPPGGMLLLPITTRLPEPAELAAAELWLEQTVAAMLVLRRGTGPSYQLSPGLELHSTSTGGLIFSRSPLLVFRLNQQGLALLHALGPGATALELALRCPGFELPALTTFLDILSERRLLRRSPGTSGWPRVSVVVPAHGRHQQTRACIESLLALDYPGELSEIIVVDDASQPPLATVLADLPVQLVRHEQSQGPSAARNVGIALARGAVVAFTDNDCLVQPDWLRKLIPYLGDPRIGFVGGRVVGPPEGGPIMAFEAVRSSLDMGAEPGAVGIGERIPYMPSCNLLVRRSLLVQLDGFQATMPIGEDVDLIWRGRVLGAQAQYAPEGVVVHYHRSRLGAFLRRRAFYARSEVDLLRRHPASRRLMHLPLTVLLGLAALGLVLTIPGLALALLGLAVGLLLAEVRTKRNQLQPLELALGPLELAVALLRAHHAALYHLGMNLLRYYSLPLLALALLWPTLLLPLLLLCLIPPLRDLRRLRPALPAWQFVALFWLELSAYQVGIWLGCLRWRTLWPLLPKLRWIR